MRTLVDILCSERCAGRRPGTPEGRAAHPEGPIAFADARRDDLTLRSLIEITASLAALSPEAEQGRAYAQALLASCDRAGRLPAGREHEVGMLVGLLESRLA